MQKFQFQVLTVVLILVGLILSQRFFSGHSFINQTTVAIVMGALVGIVVKIFYREQETFSNSVFFDLLLPPIIFHSGFSLHRSLFYKNIGTILFLGVPGTIFTYVFLYYSLVLLNSQFFHSELGQIDLMILACVLCATDSVAIMAVVKKDQFPRLNSVLFGEGIMNDATAIILFRSILEFNKKNAQNGALYDISINFIKLITLSTALGLILGLVVTWSFKATKGRHQVKSVHETGFIVLSSYLCYLVGQLLNLSGVIALFIYGIVIGSYCLNNLTGQSQKGIGLVFQTCSYLAQSFVFVYLGMQIIDLPSNLFAISFAIPLLPLLPISRLLCLALFLLIFRLFRQGRFNWREISLIWYSGLMRGAVALALSFLYTNKKNTKLIQHIVLLVVLSTSITVSLFSRRFIQSISLQAEPQEQSASQLSWFRWLSQKYLEPYLLSQQSEQQI